MLRKMHLTSEPSARSRAGSRLLDRSRSHLHRCRAIVIGDWKEIGRNTPPMHRIHAHSALNVHWHNRPDCRRSLYYVDGLILMSSDVKRLRVIVNLHGRSRVSRQITLQRAKSDNTHAEKREKHLEFSRRVSRKSFLYQTNNDPNLNIKC